jgi:hypothetical protein
MSMQWQPSPLLLQSPPMAHLASMRISHARATTTAAGRVSTRCASTPCMHARAGFAWLARTFLQELWPQLGPLLQNHDTSSDFLQSVSRCLCIIFKVQVRRCKPLHLLNTAVPQVLADVPDAWPAQLQRAFSCQSVHLIPMRGAPLTMDVACGWCGRCLLLHSRLERARRCRRWWRRWWQPYSGLVASTQRSPWWLRCRH